MCQSRVNTHPVDTDAFTTAAFGSTPPFLINFPTLSVSFTTACGSCGITTIADTAATVEDEEDVSLSASRVCIDTKYGYSLAMKKKAFKKEGGREA